MTDEKLLSRVAMDAKICAGRPYIRGTQISLAIILDALTRGLTPQAIIDHYPALKIDDIHAALAYAIKLAELNAGVAVLGDRGRDSLSDPR